MKRLTTDRSWEKQAKTLKMNKEKVMDDLDDVVKRYTEECVSLLAESVQKHLKDLQEENAKLKAENATLQREVAFFYRMSLM